MDRPAAAVPRRAGEYAKDFRGCGEVPLKDFRVARGRSDFRGCGLPLKDLRPGELLIEALNGLGEGLRLVGGLRSPGVRPTTDARARSFARRSSALGCRPTGLSSSSISSSSRSCSILMIVALAWVPRK